MLFAVVDSHLGRISNTIIDEKEIEASVGFDNLVGCLVEAITLSGCHRPPGETKL